MSKNANKGCETWRLTPFNIPGGIESVTDFNVAILVGCDTVAPCPEPTSGAQSSVAPIAGCKNIYSGCYEICAEPGTSVTEVISWTDADGNECCISHCRVVPGLRFRDLCNIAAFLFGRGNCDADVVDSPYWRDLAQNTLGGTIAVLSQSGNWINSGKDMVLNVMSCLTNNVAFQIQHTQSEEQPKATCNCSSPKAPQKGCCSRCGGHC